MKKILPGMVGLVALGTLPATAADTALHRGPPIFAPIYDWSGGGFSHNAGPMRASVTFPPFRASPKAAMTPAAGWVDGQIRCRWQFVNRMSGRKSAWPRTDRLASSTITSSWAPARSI